MANRKYYHSEVIEFQNGDKTIAKQLTLKKLKIVNKIFSEHDAEQRKNQRRIDAAIAQAKQEDPKNFDEEDVFRAVSQEIEDEGGKTYVDTLADGCVIALNAWGVMNERDKKVADIDIDYVEENLDFPTMARICEIAGSMELGKRDDAEGKEA